MLSTSIPASTPNSTAIVTDTSSASSSTTPAPQVRSLSNSDKAALLWLGTMNIPNQFLKAVVDGNRALAGNLIQQGVPVNHTDPTGKTALAIAAMNGDIDMIRDLLKAGADADGSPKSAMQWLVGGVSMRGGSRSGLAVIGCMAVTAAYGGIGFLVGALAVYTMRTMVSMTPDSCTPLIMAAQFDRTAAVELLSASGAIIDFTDAHRHTALMHAAENGCTASLNVLLKKKASVNLTDNNDQTALMFAAKNGHLGTLDALIAAGAKIDAADCRGRTALILAAENGHTKTLNALIIKKANLNYCASQRNSIDDSNIYDGTALIFAARNGHTETVEALIAAKAKVDRIATFRDGPNDGSIPFATALTFAASNNHTATLEVLLKQNPTAKECSTALTIATMRCHHAAVEILTNDFSKRLG